MVFWGAEMFNENVLKLNLRVRCYLNISIHRTTTTTQYCTCFCCHWYSQWRAWTKCLDIFEGKRDHQFDFFMYMSRIEETGGYLLRFGGNTKNYLCGENYISLDLPITSSAAVCYPIYYQKLFSHFMWSNYPSFAHFIAKFNLLCPKRPTTSLGTNR